ncbi:MAG: hypothetical protein ACI93R_002796 [Flavobacteriales bacterium]|jgi:hypothetical protein
MHILINIIVTLLLLFWVCLSLISLTILAGPLAANEMSTWWTFIILYSLPVVVSAIYWAVGGHFWGISGYSLTKGFSIFYVIAMLMLNVPGSVWRIYQGKKNN